MGGLPSQFTVNPIHSFVIEAQTLNVANIGKAQTESPIAVLLR